MIAKQTITGKAFFFYFKIFQHNEKTTFAHFRQELQMYVIKLHQGEINYKKKINTNKKAIWRNLLFIQNEAISLVAMLCKEWWLVQENRATVTPDPNVTLGGMKTYNES